MECKGVGDYLECRKNWQIFIVFEKRKKLTQFQLAEKLGVSDKTISKWERGACLPKMDMIEIITKFFDISIAEFYSGERDLSIHEKDKNKTKEEKIIDYSVEYFKCKKQ